MLKEAIVKWLGLDVERANPASNIMSQAKSIGAVVTNVTNPYDTPTVSGQKTQALTPVIGPDPVNNQTPEGVPFGPLQPIGPFYQREMRDRIRDYKQGFNLEYTPGYTKVNTFATLRTFANNYDILRLCIETRKDQMCAINWDIRYRDKTKDSDEDCAAVVDFFKFPDGEHDFYGWMRMLLEEMLVIDGATLYPRVNKGGELLSLDPIDGSLISLKIDALGRRPKPPSTAYQQILIGLPAVDYCALDMTPKPIVVPGSELIYHIRNPRTHELYGYCYDSETEILTKDNGWVNFINLTKKDLVATRAKDGFFEWQQPTEYINQQYSGDMIHFNSRSMDIMVTPNHRMLVNSLPRALKIKYEGYGESVITAEELETNLTHETKIPVTSKWIGTEVTEQIFEDDSRKQNINISGNDFCALLGAYIAEGNLKSTGGIEIAQQETSKGYKLYKELFDKLGGWYNKSAFILSKSILTSYFKQFGHAHEKFIPNIIKNATPEQIMIFLQYYLAGDGHFQSYINYSGRGDNDPIITSMTTVSKRLADDLVELFQKIGKSASVKSKKAFTQTFIVKGKEYTSDCRESYRISVRKSSAMSVKSERINYNGTIHCVTVPNGIVYVRRNGKPCWSGNSHVEQILMIINIALRREVNQLQFFTEGSLPDLLIAAPSDWTADQINDFQEMFDTLLSGNTAERRKARFIPSGGGLQIHDTKERALKDDYDEWLARIVCYCFSLPATPFVKGSNRATADTAKESAEEEGLEPIKRWFASLMNLIIARYFSRDMEFCWDENNSIDPLTQASIYKIFLQEYVMSPEEVREELGMKGDAPEKPLGPMVGQPSVAPGEAPPDGETPPTEPEPSPAGVTKKTTPRKKRTEATEKKII